jgi:carbamoyl-phosphate synthase large subunit
VKEDVIRQERHALGLRPAYKTVDTCAGEFPSSTPYLYSSYDEENEASASGQKTVMILGSGPNRIGQGVEFDYCCVRAVMAFREMGYRTVMVNSNPETVSTDYDTADTLYFEPLTLEDVLEIAAVEQPPSGAAESLEEAIRVAARIGYPILVRPSYVLGGRGMRIVYDEATLKDYFASAVRVAPGHPVLIDSFLEDAFEADVDAIADGTQCIIGGVMQHIEDAGIHSGDSACVLPPYLITDDQVDQMRKFTREFALRLGVVGLINVQYAIKHGKVFVLEVNPRGSRTVPFVSKTTGVQLAGLAAAVMIGKTLEELGLSDDVLQPYVAVKEAVFPFNKLHGVDLILGPEMRSTGEVMGIADSFGMAFAKAQISADGSLPLDGAIFVTVNDHDKANVTPIARRFHEMGFKIYATAGTARHLRARGVPAESVLKVYEGRPNAIDLMLSGRIHLLINTPLGKLTQQDDYAIRRAALQQRVPYTTTLSAASAASDAIIALRSRERTVCSLQEWHALAREYVRETAG